MRCFFHTQLNLLNSSVGRVNVIKHVATFDEFVDDDKQGAGGRSVRINSLINE